jgi:hypothetical protein
VSRDGIDEIIDIIIYFTERDIKDGNRRYVNERLIIYIDMEINIPFSVFLINTSFSVIIGYIKTRKIFTLI